MCSNTILTLIKYNVINGFYDSEMSGVYLVKQEFKHRGETHKGYCFYTDEEYIQFMDVFDSIWKDGKVIWLYYEIADYDYVDIYFDRSAYMKSVDAVLLSEDTYKVLAEYMPEYSGETFVGALYDAAREPSYVLSRDEMEANKE